MFEGAWAALNRKGFELLLIVGEFIPIETEDGPIVKIVAILQE